MPKTSSSTDRPSAPIRNTKAKRCSSRRAKSTRLATVRATQPIATPIANGSNSSRSRHGSLTLAIVSRPRPHSAQAIGRSQGSPIAPRKRRTTWAARKPTVTMAPADRPSANVKPHQVRTMSACGVRPGASMQVAGGERGRPPAGTATSTRPGAPARGWRGACRPGGRPRAARLAGVEMRLDGAHGVGLPARGGRAAVVRRRRATRRPLREARTRGAAGRGRGPSSRTRRGSRGASSMRSTARCASTPPRGRARQARRPCRTTRSPASADRAPWSGTP